MYINILKNCLIGLFTKPYMNEKLTYKKEMESKGLFPNMEAVLRKEIKKT